MGLSWTPVTLNNKKTDVSSRQATPNEQCESWVRLGLHYSCYEYRACWKLEGQPLVQRLSEKNHSWDSDGLASLFPNGLAQGLSGYAFNCPDMVGGGQYEDLIRPDFKWMASCLSGMRNAPPCSRWFSTAPWRVLDETHLKYCIDAAGLHTRLGTEIAEWIQAAGESIMRHMAYVFPEEIWLGDDGSH